jgi:hypothetical protein
VTYSTWPRLAQIYRALANGEIKLIGWGAGAQMRRHYLTAHYPLSYVIDSRPELAGSTFLGREVRAPQALLEEDPAAVAVMVGPTRSVRQEIADQIGAMGPYDVVTPYSAELAERFCLTMDQLAASALSRKPPTSSTNGIVVQGPFDPGGTPTLMRILATHYPDDWIVWSTWEDTPSEVLEQIRPWCDGVVLSRPPSQGGNGNCNLQRQTTLAGLKWLRERGVELALKTRSDGVPLAPDLFTRTRALYQAMAALPAAAGLRRRIIVSSVFTIMHVPLHISDIIQMGDVGDLEALWSFPEDAGPLWNPSDPAIQGLPLAEVSRMRLMGEHWIGHQLADLAGLKVDYSIEQHLDLVRDSLIVVDPQWFDLFLPKYHPTAQSLFSRTADYPKDLIDFQTWMGLQARDPAFIARAVGVVDVNKTSWLDLVAGVRG